jgi:ankyrin repeat protein
MGILKGHTFLFTVALSLALIGVFGGCRKRTPTAQRETPKVARQITPSEMAMLTAAQANDLATVKDLLGKGVDANMRGPDRNTPIMEAAYAGHVEMAKLLLDHGADLSAKKTDGASATLLIGDHKDVGALFKNVSQLVDAASSGDMRTLQELIDSGTPVNGLDQNGRAALNEAAWNAKTEAVKLLLDKGANPNIRKADGASPADRAAGQKHQDIVDLLNAAIAKRRTAPTATAGQ